MRVVKFVPLIQVSKDVWQADTRVFVSRSHLESGPLGPLAVIEFADLSNPVVTYYEPSANGISTDVEASSQYLWLAHEACAGTTFPTPLFRWPLGDLTQPPLPLNPSDFSQCEAMTGCTTGPSTVDACHTIKVASAPGGPELLLCSGTSGSRALHILDITQDPPVHRACWQPPAAIDPPCGPGSEGVHESFLWQDPQGRLLVATATLGQGLSILELNLGAGSLTRIFHACYDGHFPDQLGAGLETNTHSAWVSDDARHLFTSDERAGAWVLAWDLASISACTGSSPQTCGNDPAMCTPPLPFPVCARQVGKFRKSGVGYQSIPHNLFAQGDLLYVAHYSEGVRVLDITDPTALETSEVAFFDTFLGPTCPELPTCAALGGVAEDGTWGLTPRGPFLVVAEQQSGVYFLEQFPSYFPVPLAEGPSSERMIETGYALAAIATADFDRDGTPDVATAAAGDLTGDLTVYRNNGDSSFSDTGFNPTCGSPGPGPLDRMQALAAGDYDGDGDGDLVVGFRVGGHLADRYLRLLRSDGSGGFTCVIPTIPLGTCTGPLSLAAGHLGGGPGLDLVVGICNQVITYLGDGAGNFNQSFANTEANGVAAVAIGDYDGDGFNDIGYALLNSNLVHIRRNDQSGGFATICRTLTSTLNDPRSLAFGALNADLLADLAVGNAANSTVTAVLSAGCAAPQMSAHSLGGLLPVPGSVGIGQLNYQDTLGDIAVAAGAGATVVLVQEPPVCATPPCFQAERTFSGGRRLLVGDFNRDNKHDVATSLASGLYLLHGLGDGNLRDAIKTPLAGATTRATGDFNSDGNADIVVFDGSASPVKVLVGDGTGKFTTPGNATCNSAADIPNPSDVVAADFNADGSRDLAVCDAGTNEIVVCLGDGAGGFTPQSGFATFVTSTAAIAAGVLRTNSTNLDLVVAGTASNEIAVYFGDGTGIFAPPVKYGPIGLAPIDLVVGNLNIGSALDIAVAARDSKEVWVLLNDTTGFFPTRTAYSTLPALPTSVDLGDFGNGTIPVDGFLDALTGNTDGTVSLLYNDTLGGLAGPTHITVGKPLGSFPDPDRRQALALDLDSDSRPEIVAANPESLAVVARDANGVLLATAYQYRAFTGGVLETADFDGDFSPDVATGAVDMLGNRGGYWPVRQCLPSPGEPVAVEAFDFLDGDGHLDLVTVNRASKKLYQYRGNGDATFQTQGSVDLPLPPPLGSPRSPVAMDLAVGPLGPLLVIADEGANAILRTTAAPGVGFGTPTAIDLGSFKPKLVALANFDEIDTIPGNDVAVVGTGTGGLELRVYYDVDTTTTPFLWSYPLGFDNVEGLAIGRLNSDAYTDIVVSVDQTVAPDSIQVFRRLPPGRDFWPPVATTIEPIPEGVRARGVVVQDYNGGDPEVVVANEGTPSDVRVMRRTDDLGSHVWVETTRVSPGAFALATGSINGIFTATAPNDLWVVHRDQTTHPATALVTGLLSPNNTMEYLANAGLALGSFDGPAIATGDFTTLVPLTTPADGLAIVNRGRHNLCVVQFQ